MDFSSRNQHAAKSWQFTNHFATDESSDSFFADTQCDCGVIDVQRLTLGFGRCRVHNRSFTRPQHATYDDFLGVAATQPGR